jgi:hypothetical protein
MNLQPVQTVGQKPAIGLMVNPLRVRQRDKTYTAQLEADSLDRREWRESRAGMMKRTITTLILLAAGLERSADIILRLYGERAVRWVVLFLRVLNWAVYSKLSTSSVTMRRQETLWTTMVLRSRL